MTGKGGAPQGTMDLLRMERAKVRYLMKNLIDSYHQKVPQRKNRFIPKMNQIFRKDEGASVDPGPVDLSEVGIFDYEDMPHVQVRWRISDLRQNKANGGRARQTLVGSIPPDRHPTELQLSKGHYSEAERREFEYTWNHLKDLHQYYVMLGRQISKILKAERDAHNAVLLHAGRGLLASYDMLGNSATMRTLLTSLS